MEGGGVCELVSRQPVNLAAAGAATAPLPDPCLYANSRPVWTPPTPPGRLTVLVPCPRLHGRWHVTRADRWGTGQVIRYDAGALSIVLTRAPPLAHSGADGALVCPVRLGQPSASGWSRRATLWFTLGVLVRPAPRPPHEARSWPIEVPLLHRSRRGLSFMAV